MSPTSPEALARKQLGLPPKQRNQASSAVARLRKQAVTVGVMIGQDTEGRVTCVKLHGYSALSWQVIWRGTDHRVRSIAKRAYAQPVVNALENTPLPIRQHEAPVRLEVQVFGRGNLVDPENVCIKPITDEMVKHGVLRDDTCHEIEELRVRVQRSAEAYPYMVITLEAA